MAREQQRTWALMTLGAVLALPLGVVLWSVWPSVPVFSRWAVLVDPSVSAAAGVWVWRVGR